MVPFSRASGGDVTDPDAIARAIEGAEAVVHLVAILDGSDAQFETVNAQGPRKSCRPPLRRPERGGSCT